MYHKPKESKCILKCTYLYAPPGAGLIEGRKPSCHTTHVQGLRRGPGWRNPWEIPHREVSLGQILSSRSTGRHGTFLRLQLGPASVFLGIITTSLFCAYRGCPRLPAAHLKDAVGSQAASLSTFPSGRVTLTAAWAVPIPCPRAPEADRAEEIGAGVPAGGEPGAWGNAERRWAGPAQGGISRVKNLLCFSCV